MMDLQVPGAGEPVDNVVVSNNTGGQHGPAEGALGQANGSGESRGIAGLVSLF